MVRGIPAGGKLVSDTFCGLDHMIPRRKRFAKEAMPRFSVSVVIVAVFFIIGTQAFNVDKLLKEHFDEEDADESEPAKYLR